MPFTFSHPAIVLPLTFLPRQWFSLTGLVIGSLTPDFEYFLRMKIQSEHSHTLNGIFWFDLPLGLLLSFIFHNIVRDSLFDNLPIVFKSRLISFKQFDWNSEFKRNWLTITISIILGAASHILWDSFTHDHGYFTEMIPLLTNSIDLLGAQIPNYKMLQHLSTIIGGLIIAFAFLQLPKDKNATVQFDIKYWSVLIILILIIISLRLLCGLNYKLFGHLIVTCISAGLISLIVTPLLTKRKV